MVTYQKWTSIAFQEAKNQGFETTQENNASLISVAAEVWRDRKSDLETATVSEAKRIASQEIDVR